MCPMPLVSGTSPAGCLCPAPIEFPGDAGKLSGITQCMYTGHLCSFVLLARLIANWHAELGIIEYSSSTCLVSLISFGNSLFQSATVSVRELHTWWCQLLFILCMKCIKWIHNEEVVAVSWWNFGIQGQFSGKFLFLFILIQYYSYFTWSLKKACH